MKLFVYGSLKPGGWAHHLLQNNVSNPEKGWIIGAEIYNVKDWYPALNLESALGTDATVFGIIYDIIENKNDSLFINLDNLEGYPTLFDKGMITVETDSGPVNAMVYFGKDQSLFIGDVIENGIWDVT